MDPRAEKSLDPLCVTEYENNPEKHMEAEGYKATGKKLY